MSLIQSKDDPGLLASIRAATLCLDRQGLVPLLKDAFIWKNRENGPWKFLTDCVSRIFTEIATANGDRFNSRAKWRQWSQGEISKALLKFLAKALSCIPQMLLSKTRVDPNIAEVMGSAVHAATTLSLCVLAEEGTMRSTKWPQLESWLKLEGLARALTAQAVLIRHTLHDATPWERGVQVLLDLNKTASLFYCSSWENTSHGVHTDHIIALCSTSLKYCNSHARKWLEANSVTGLTFLPAQQPLIHWLDCLQCLHCMFHTPSLTSTNWRPMTHVLVQSFQLARDILAQDWPEDPALVNRLYLALDLPLQIFQLSMTEGGGSSQVWPIRCALQAMQIAVLPRRRLLTHDAEAKLSSLQRSVQKDAGILVNIFVLRLLKPKQLWDVMCQMEETMRLTAPHISASELQHMVPLWGSMLAACEAMVHGVGAPTPGQPEQLCPSLLKIVSMGLTMAKATEMLPPGLDLHLLLLCRSLTWSVSLMCHQVARAGRLPKRMRVIQGLAALTIPTCCSVLTMGNWGVGSQPMDRAEGSYLTHEYYNVLGSIRAVLGGISEPQLCLSAMLSDPVWVAIQAASKIVQHQQVALAGLQPSRFDHSQLQSLDSLVIETAALMALLVDSLACTALSVPPFRLAQQHQPEKDSAWCAPASECYILLVSGPAEGMFGPARFEQVASEMRCHPDEGDPPGTQLNSSSATEVPLSGRSEAEVLGAMSKVLASDVWQVLLAALPDMQLLNVAAVAVCTCFHQLLIVLQKLVGAPCLDALFVEAGTLIGNLSSCCILEFASGMRSGELVPCDDIAKRVGARDMGLDLLGLLRRILMEGLAAAPTRVPPGVGGGGVVVGSWDRVRAELMLGLPEELWGTGPCCNSACLQMGGPSELTVKTLACMGGCGARYCCEACQVQAWGGGHQRNCAVMKEARDRYQAGRQV